MKRLVKQAVFGLALAGTMAVAATPAEARYYGRHYYRHHDDAGWAIGAGLLGLAAGAAIASNRGYGYGYYGGGYYDRPYGYYRPYRAGYWGPRCFMRRSWDYWGRPVWMRICR